MSHAPSDSELAILKHLWTEAPQSARSIHEGAGMGLGWSLSSTRTTIARMVAKGLLTEAKCDGVRVYAPGEAKTRTVAGLLRRFFGRVLELEGPLPVAAFTGGGLLSDAEIAEIEALLAEAEDPEDAA